MFLIIIVILIINSIVNLRGAHLTFWHSAASFPLTPALSPGERENRSPIRWRTRTQEKCEALQQPKHAINGSLSLRERAGVRGKESF